MRIRAPSIGFLLLLLVSGCRVAGVATSTGDAAPGAALPDRFSLLCWNVQKGKDRNLAARLQGLADELAPDLILLQEADAKIAQARGYGSVFAPAC